MTDESSKPITSPKDILVLAFRALNDPDPDAKASACEEQLASQLNVHTVLDLVEALGINDDQKLVETRALLKDKLVKALRGVIEELKKDGRLAASIKLPPPSKTRRTLSISRVDWQQLSKISQKDMSFDIELFVQAAFVDGAKDPDLRAPSDKFPVDVLGRPTFRPSANWFLSQVDFTTLAKFPMHTRMSSVVTAGNDLQLNKKIAGSFYEDFDGLWAFPFDMQILTVNLVFTVANEGATPIDLAFAEKVDTSVVDQASFADKNAWHIANELHLELTSVVASSGRTYPAMAISVRVYRRPFFFLINVAMPTGLFALLGIAIMSLPVNYPPARLTYMLTHADSSHAALHELLHAFYHLSHIHRQVSAWHGRHHPCDHLRDDRLRFMAKPRRDGADGGSRRSGRHDLSDCLWRPVAAGEFVVGHAHVCRAHEAA